MSSNAYNFLDNRKNINILKRILLKETKDPNILTRLINLVNAPDYDVIVYEAASRIIAIFLSELDPKYYWIQQENFINQLLLAERYFSKSDFDSKKF